MSKTTRIIVLVTLAILAATIASRFTATSHAEFMGNLNGNVGPGATISLSTTDGTLVTSLGAGSYAIHVVDQATNHNFHLEGPGVNVATGISDIQTVDWTVEIPAGSFTYHCDQHASLTASFAATGGAPLVTPPIETTPPPVLTPTPAPTPAPVPTPTPAPTVTSTSTGTPPAPISTARTLYTGTINVTLTAKNKLVVTKSGKPVTSLDTGNYKLVVTDNSKQRSIMLRRANATPKQLTSTAFTGKKSVGFEFFGGTWRLYVGGSEKSLFSLLKVSD